MIRNFPIFLTLIFLSCGDSTKNEEVLFLHENGNPKIIKVTSNNHDKNTYKRIQYHENGAKQGEGLMKNNKQHGKWEYWNKAGQKIAESKYNDGNQIDTILCWYETGELKNYELFVSFFNFNGY